MPPVSCGQQHPHSGAAGLRSRRAWKPVPKPPLPLGGGCAHTELCSGSVGRPRWSGSWREQPWCPGLGSGVLPPSSWPQTTWETWPLGGRLGQTLWEARSRDGSGPGPQPTPSWVSQPLEPGCVVLSQRRGAPGPQEVLADPSAAPGLTEPPVRKGWLQESWALTLLPSEQRGTHKGLRVSASGF